ncbi:unnamed protein product [Caenorhabditis angaria]|uniref:Uncharacterized protein n=1 Tax=Caenorhabditis angaria TaxID=860376 RepID=A0A9P1MWH7_9PELO|nr:unnamed protein product [Caenorhabditis angaria]
MDFLVFLGIIFGIIFGAVKGCESLHSSSHGVNLICCSLDAPLIETCEYTSFCREHCSCFLTITQHLECAFKNTSDSKKFKFLDHQTSAGSQISCRDPNLPNPTVPYTVVIEEADEKKTYEFLLGMCGYHVTSLTLQTYSQLFDQLDFSTCFPDLASFQIISPTRKLASFQKSLKNLRNLTVLSLVNVDFEFWLSEPPFIENLNYLHIENSTLSEIPKWFAKSQAISDS